MPRTYPTKRIAALQLPSKPRYQENLEILLDRLAALDDVDVVVVPEVFLTAYDYEHLSTAAKFAPKALKAIKQACGDRIVVLTLLIEEGGVFYNQAVVIHNGKIVHRQEKVKLFKLGDEDKYLAAGKARRIKPFTIDGVTYAILICFELRFKELWKQIEGADIVFVPARWGLPRKRHLEILSDALAVMNQCYVAVANSSDADMAASSAIIDPNGEAVRDDASDTIVTDADMKEVATMRRYIVLD